MAITTDFDFRDGVLYVKVSGEDDSVDDVIGYGQAVIQQALQHNATRILSDETDLVYRIGTFDVFASAKALAENAPRIVRAALVVNPVQIKDARFFETVAINRGLDVRMFTSFEEAKTWLLKP